MHPSLMIAQATTLTNWAEQWEHDISVWDGDVEDHPALHLRKAVAAIKKVQDPSYKETLGLHEIPVSPVVTAPRTETAEAT